jgi:hypothetical protein
MGLTACGDDPFSFRWDDAPDTVLIYSLSRPELNLASGISFLPPGALGITARARISVLGAVNFDEVMEAPEDTLLYQGDEAVPVSDGTVYIVSSNRRAGSFGSSCVYYAKIQPVTIDVPGRTLLLRYVASPICNSRDLVPPE